EEEIKTKEEAVEYVKRLVSEEGEKKGEALYAKRYPL
ncbi:unnamed protein product, partial [marine sediment metagenome]